MTELFKNNWFTEVHEKEGSAFSMRIKSKVASQQSPFQLVEVYDTTDFGYLMVIDGFTMVSSKENFMYHEMISHPALLSHANPKDVVIIGGGDCGTLQEVLKHKSVETATQVDIDEVVTQMAEKYFPELCARNQDPRANIMFDDGIKYMREVAPASLDIVIVDSTDPVGPGEGLFNHAFYKSCLDALRPGGILVQQSESPLIHLQLLTDMRAAMKDVGFADLQTLNFPQMIYPSGWWSCTLARRDEKIGDFRLEAARTLATETLYFNAEIHQGAKALPNFVRQAFDTAGA